MNDPTAIVPVLLYHRIAVAAHDRYSVSPASFDAHLREISASGRTPLTVSEYAELLKGGGWDGRRYVALTFDDGYAETFEAVRSLTTRGLKATVYVTTGQIGTPGMLTADQIATLLRMQGVEVGAHTVSHPYLDELDRGELSSEIAGSRRVLQVIGGDVRSFAYPHGAYDAAVRAAVLAAGYESAAAVKNALSHRHDDPWAVARCTVLGSTSSEQLRRLLDGQGAPLAWAHERRRTRAYRSVRRLRRRLVYVREAEVSDSAFECPSGGSFLTLATPVAVRSLDISLGFPAVDLPLARTGTPYRGLAALLRRGPSPIDWVGVEVPPGGTVAGEQIEHALYERGGCRPDASTPGVEPLELRPELASLAESTYFSYVVTTCNKPALALRCVRAISASGPGPCEIIVVENRPVGSTVRETLLSALSDDERVRVLDEPTPGLSHARNAGLRAAKGEVIAFTDDDIAVDAHWCQSLRSAFACYPDVACVAGPILPLELETAPQLLMERFSPIGTAFARRVYAMDRPPVDQPLFPYTAGFFGSGGNAAFRWDALAGLKGFDPVLGTGTWARGGEDLDIFIRLLLAGGRLLYEPCAIAWHPHPATMERLSHEVFDYGVGLGAMLTKQLLAGPRRSQLVREIPRGIEYLFSPASHKNAGKASGYPQRLDRLERIGVALGPAAYLSSRWRAQRRRPADDERRPVRSRDQAS